MTARNCIPNAITSAIRSMVVASIRRVRHYRPRKLGLNRLIRKLHRVAATFTALHLACGKSLPFALRTAVEIERIFTYPILHPIGLRIGILPRDANCADWVLGLQIDNHPLRMERIGFPSEFARQIWVALPITEVWGRHSRVTAGREASMRQSIGKNVARRLLEVSASGEVAALMRRIAPCSVLRPVPGRHPELAVVAVRDRPPSRRQRLLDDMRRKDFVDSSAR